MMIETYCESDSSCTDLPTIETDDEIIKKLVVEKGHCDNEFDAINHRDKEEATVCFEYTIRDVETNDIVEQQHAASWIVGEDRLNDGIKRALLSIYLGERLSPRPTTSHPFVDHLWLLLP